MEEIEEQEKLSIAQQFKRFSRYIELVRMTEFDEVASIKLAKHYQEEFWPDLFDHLARK